MSQETLSWLSTIEDVVEDARAGRMFILVDDEDRENEGDLVIPAQMATADAVNFMATLRPRPDLPVDDAASASRSSACSSWRRATARATRRPSRYPSRRARASRPAFPPPTAPAPSPSPSTRTRRRDDIVTPGHVFPLVAQDGGVLVRAGHTEAAVDISRLAGLNPAGVICEIMNDDGTMARMPDLVTFAQTPRAQDRDHRRPHRLSPPQRAARSSWSAETRIDSRFGGEFDVRVYANTVQYAEHIALVRGDISGAEPVLVRMHQANMLADSLGDVTRGRILRRRSPQPRRRTRSLHAA